jgi:hypothetical protein
MKKLSDRAQDAFETFKTEMAANAAAEKQHKDMIEAEMASFQQTFTKAQEKVNDNVADILSDVFTWAEFPEDLNKVDAKIVAAMLYYVQTEPMAQSHFKGSVTEDFVNNWNTNGVSDAALQESVSKEMQALQSDLMPLAEQEQELAMKQQMMAQMMPENVPMLKTLIVPPSKGSDTYEVVMIPFMLDEDHKLETNNIPFEFYVGAYVKENGMQGDFNEAANIKRVDPVNGPTSFEHTPENGKAADSVLFVVGHVEQKGQLMGPLNMPPQMLVQQPEQARGMPGMKPPTIN